MTSVVRVNVFSEIIIHSPKAINNEGRRWKEWVERREVYQSIN